MFLKYVPKICADIMNCYPYLIFKTFFFHLGAVCVCVCVCVCLGGENGACQRKVTTFFFHLPFAAQLIPSLGGGNREPVRDRLLS